MKSRASAALFFGEFMLHFGVMMKLFHKLMPGIEFRFSLVLIFILF